jgi:hypothetical protein
MNSQKIACSDEYYSRLMKRLFLLLITLVFFQGCIGAGMIGNVAATILDPLIGPEMAGFQMK